VSLGWDSPSIHIFKSHQKYIFLLTYFKGKTCKLKMSNSPEDVDSGNGSAGLVGSPGAMEAFNMGGVGRDVQAEAEQPSMRYVSMFRLHASFCYVHSMYA
jgi:hypothetical protein